MILKLLLKIWPAFIPVLLYLLWYFLIRPRVQDPDADPGKKRERTLRLWVAIASLAIAFLCFLLFGLMQEPVKDSFHPPRMGPDGTLIPGYYDKAAP